MDLMAKWNTTYGERRESWMGGAEVKTILMQVTGSKGRICLQRCCVFKMNQSFTLQATEPVGYPRGKRGQCKAGRQECIGGWTAAASPPDVRGETAGIALSQFSTHLEGVYLCRFTAIRENLSDCPSLVSISLSWCHCGRGRNRVGLSPTLHRAGCCCLHAAPMGQGRGVSKKDCPTTTCCKSATPNQSFNELRSWALCTVWFTCNSFYSFRP